MDVDTAQRQPDSSGWWRDHFARNRTHFDHVKWDACDITAVEAKAIGKSIAEFQLGESSEGKHLIHCAKEHAARIDDPEYPAAIGYFVAEENSHARALGRFMDAAGLKRAERTNVDSVFRLLRKGMRLEVSISVLLTAELIAQVYYQALHDATGSATLRVICRQILIDEERHVRFQSQRLAILQRFRARTGLRLSVAARRMLMAGTIGVVWVNHRRALRRGGFGLWHFARESWRVYRASEAMSDPRGYDWHADAIVDAAHS